MIDFQDLLRLLTSGFEFVYKAIHLLVDIALVVAIPGLIGWFFQWAFSKNKKNKNGNDKGRA